MELTREQFAQERDALLREGHAASYLTLHMARRFYDLGAKADRAWCIRVLALLAERIRASASKAADPDRSGGECSFVDIVASRILHPDGMRPAVLRQR